MCHKSRSVTVCFVSSLRNVPRREELSKTNEHKDLLPLPAIVRIATVLLKPVLLGLQRGSKSLCTHCA
jgi:hypothetical protein